MLLHASYKILFSSYGCVLCLVLPLGAYRSMNFFFPEFVFRNFSQLVNFQFIYFLGDRTVDRVDGRSSGR